jgi:hypothetical protein
VMSANHQWVALNGARQRGRMVAVVVLILLPVTLPAASAHEVSRSSGSADCTWQTVAPGEMPRGITDVAAVSSSDVWAVGPEPFAERPQAAVIAHWNGRRLELIRPRGLRADTDDGLAGIAAVSARDVWAVGSSRGEPLTLHWDGTLWRRVRTPRLSSGAVLYDIVALSRTNAWAVGFVGDPLRTINPLVMHWNGKAWKVVRIRTSGAFYAIGAAAPPNLWAVGDDNGSGGSITEVDALAMHWDGRRWRIVSTPTPDDANLGYEAIDEFTGVDVVSPGAAWAVHSAAASSDIQRWNGRKWRISVRYRNRSLADVAALSPLNVWAVGGTSHPLIVHWDGVNWTRVTPPRLRQLRTSIEAISAVGPRELWVAGSRLLAHGSC